MARAVEEFEEIINNAIASKPELMNMNSVSDTAIYRLLRTIIAEVANIVDKSFEVHKSEVEEIVAKNKVLRLDWYRKQALLFQYGDDLSIDANDVIGYAVEDSSKRIVTRAAAIANGGQIKIKVAKGEPGALEVLNVSELAALQGYFDVKQGAGDQVEVISLGNDTMVVRGTYYYNPLITLSAAQNALISALNNYLSGLAFNGELHVISLEDKIQQAAGFKDLDFVYQAKAVADTNYTNISRNYVSTAGQIELDSDFVSNISNYITFKPLANVPN